MAESERGAGEAQRDDAARERDCWMRVYEEYYDRVKRYIARRVKCPHDVDDLVQSVFADLVGRCGHLANPQVYVWTIARHRLFAYWRYRQRCPSIQQILPEGDDNLLAVVACDEGLFNPLERLLAQERRKAVASLMASLTPTLSTALKLRFLDGLALNEAAARAGCSREALKKRLERARQSIIELHA